MKKSVSIHRDNRDSGNSSDGSFNVHAIIILILLLTLMWNFLKKYSHSNAFELKWKF